MELVFFLVAALLHITCISSQEGEEMIPIGVQKKEGVYEVEARITDGAVMIQVAQVSTEHMPGLYNCHFRGYRWNPHDILIGLDGVHTIGWTFEKVLERIKKLAKSKPECINTQLSHHQNLLEQIKSLNLMIVNYHKQYLLLKGKKQ